MSRADCSPRYGRLPRTSGERKSGMTYIRRQARKRVLNRREFQLSLLKSRRRSARSTPVARLARECFPG